jgi:cell division septum initiation protein DivIVA
VQQLIAENERLRVRNATLERRLAYFDVTVQRIAAVVREAQGAKGVHG